MAIFPGHYIGLMSGTSLDSIDAVVVRIDRSQTELIAAYRHDFDDSLRNELTALCSPGENEIDRLGIADRLLGKALAEATMLVTREAKLTPEQIVAIGSHGQTIRHRPPSKNNPTSFSLQIGDPSTIASNTGITTVADFRKRDIAEGGHGAPLVPAFHEYAFNATGQHRAIVNVGGMANVTLLRPNMKTIGFDTGPGNILLDYWAKTHLGTDFDFEGQWANSGNPIEPLLQQFLDHPFLKTTPPKSTGRETFNASWLREKLGRHENHRAEDIQATLLELTAWSIANSIRSICDTEPSIFVCGGGAMNNTLMARLTDLLAPMPVSTTSALGLNPKWVEAVAFAWLAARTLAHLPGNLPSVTGAAREAVLGGIYLP